MKFAHGLLLIVVIIGMGKSVRCRFHRHNRDSGYLNHVQLVREFRCALPQPRAVRVERLLSLGPSPDEIFYPPSTVLARCDGSGCCPDPKHACTPLETRNVSLVFTVKHRIDSQRDRHHEIIRVVEHTKCACRALNHDGFVVP